MFLQGVGGKFLAHTRAVQHAACAVVDERGSIDASFLRVAQHGVDALSFEGGYKLLLVIRAFCIGNIIRFCNRPFEDVEMMNETIISNWNNTVGLDDTVFHLGDFCLGGSAEWTKILDRLNGKIYLILGNHDLKNLRQGYVDRFEHVTMQMHIEVDKQKIYLNHYPFLCFDGGYKDVWQLFGHVHTRKNNTGIDAARLQYLYPTQYDVGVDNNNFMPVSFAQMKIIIEKQVEQLKMKEQ